MRQPEPEKIKDHDAFGTTTIRQGKAVARGEDISKRTGLSERTVWDRLRRLETRGFVESDKGKGKGGRNRYLVKFPKREKKKVPDTTQ
jgi:predicted transcriptional regulator